MKKGRDGSERIHKYVHMSDGPHVLLGLFSLSLSASASALLAPPAQRSSLSSITSLNHLSFALYVRNACSEWSDLIQLLTPAAVPSICHRTFNATDGMGKKKGLAAIFSPKPKPKLTAGGDGSLSPPWPWPSCANNPQTASFHRHGDDDRPCTTAGRSLGPAGGRLVPRNTKAAGDDVYKTVNSVYLDTAVVDSSARFSYFDIGYDDDALELDDSMSYSTTTASEEWSEAVIRSLGRRTCTDRFFFDSGPPPASNSILAASRSSSPSPSPSPARRTVPSPSALHLGEPSNSPAAPAVEMPDDHNHRGDVDSDSEEEEEQQSPTTSSPLVEESVAVALDSEDPYTDFRASMEEMVAAHGLRDWPDLEDLLSWYLRINAKHNHHLIVGAFVDLLVGLASRSSPSSGAATTTTTTTTVTMTTTATTSSGSSSTSSSVAGDGDGAASCSTSAATIAEDEQCGGICGTDIDASCFSPAALSSDQEEVEEDLVPVGKKKAGSHDELVMRIKLCTLDSSSL